MLLIVNGRLLTMTGTDYKKGAVLIDGQTIQQVGDFDTTGLPVSRVIDASNCWVLPGLIEAHCHIGIIEERKGFEGDDCNEKTRPITPYLRALDAINPMDCAFHCALSAGITGVMAGPGSSNIVGGQFVFLKTYGRSIDNMAVLQPAAMKIAFGENPKANYHKKDIMPTTRMAIGAMLREELFEARQYYEDKKTAKEAGEPFKQEFKKECWIPVLDRMVPLKAHAHRADDILTAIRIAKEFNLKLTLDHCTEGHLIAKEIAASGFPAIVGPAMTCRNKVETQNADFKTASILHEAGVKVAITTDHPVTRIQDLPVCAGFAAREGLGVQEGLRAVTINAAEICNVSRRIGSLEPGKDADIAIFSGNPMEVFTKTLYTIVNGEVVYESKESTGASPL